MASLAALALIQALLIAALAETLSSGVLPVRTSISTERASLDSGSNFVTFEGDVKLRNEGMTLTRVTLTRVTLTRVTLTRVTLTRDVLEVEMNRGRSASAMASPKNIKVAVAKGYVVIKTENQDGKPAAATARRARYETNNDLVILSNFPNIRDGGQEVVGTSPDTKIFLSNDGRYRVEGPSRTTILQKNLKSTT